MMYSLPGGFTADAALRKCVADFLWYYPAILANPMKCLNDFRNENKDKPQTYEGDLEADYLRFLAKVQKAAKKTRWMLSLIFHKVCSKKANQSES